MAASNRTAPGQRDVSIDLTPSQITEVISTLPGNGPASSPTRRLTSLRDSASRTSVCDLYYGQELARSLIEGLMVLCAFADCKEHSTSEVAAALDISTSAAYRHIRTWAAIHVLELDPNCRLYRLAPRPSVHILGTPDTSREITG